MSFLYQFSLDSSECHSKTITPGETADDDRHHRRAASRVHLYRPTASGHGRSVSAWRQGRLTRLQSNTKRLIRRISNAKRNTVQCGISTSNTPIGGHSHQSLRPFGFVSNPAAEPVVFGHSSSSPLPQQFRRLHADRPKQLLQRFSSACFAPSTGLIKRLNVLDKPNESSTAGFWEATLSPIEQNTEQSLADCLKNGRPNGGPNDGSYGGFNDGSDGGSNGGSGGSKTNLTWEEISVDSTTSHHKTKNAAYLRCLQRAFRCQNRRLMAPRNTAQLAAAATGNKAKLRSYRNSASASRPETYLRRATTTTPTLTPRLMNLKESSRSSLLSSHHLRGVRSHLVCDLQSSKECRGRTHTYDSDKRSIGSVASSRRQLYGKDANNRLNFVEAKNGSVSLMDLECANGCLEYSNSYFKALRVSPFSATFRDVDLEQIFSASTMSRQREGLVAVLLFIQGIFKIYILKGASLSSAFLKTLLMTLHMVLTGVLIGHVCTNGPAKRVRSLFSRFTRQKACAWVLFLVVVFDTLFLLLHIPNTYLTTFFSGSRDKLFLYNHPAGKPTFIAAQQSSTQLCHEALLATFLSLFAAIYHFAVFPVSFLLNILEQLQFRIIKNILPACFASSLSLPARLARKLLSKASLTIANAKSHIFDYSCRGFVSMLPPTSWFRYFGVPNSTSRHIWRRLFRSLIGISVFSTKGRDKLLPDQEPFLTRDNTSTANTPLRLLQQHHEYSETSLLPNLNISNIISSPSHINTNSFHETLAAHNVDAFGALNVETYASHFCCACIHSGNPNASSHVSQPRNVKLQAVVIPSSYEVFHSHYLQYDTRQPTSEEELQRFPDTSVPKLRFFDLHLSIDTLGNSAFSTESPITPLKTRNKLDATVTDWFIIWLFFDFGTLIAVTRVVFPFGSVALGIMVFLLSVAYIADYMAELHIRVGFLRQIGRLQLRTHGFSVDDGDFERSDRVLKNPSPVSPFDEQVSPHPTTPETGNAAEDSLRMPQYPIQELLGLIQEIQSISNKLKSKKAPATVAQQLLTNSERMLNIVTSVDGFFSVGGASGMKVQNLDYSARLFIELYSGATPQRLERSYLHQTGEPQTVPAPTSVAGSSYGPVIPGVVKSSNAEDFTSILTGTQATRTQDIPEFNTGGVTHDGQGYYRRSSVDSSCFQPRLPIYSQSGTRYNQRRRSSETMEGWEYQRSNYLRKWGTHNSDCVPGKVLNPTTQPSLAPGNSPANYGPCSGMMLPPGTVSVKPQSGISHGSGDRFNKRRWRRNSADEALLSFPLLVPEQEALKHRVPTDLSEGPKVVPMSDNSFIRLSSRRLSLPSTMVQRSPTSGDCNRTGSLIVSSAPRLPCPKNESLIAAHRVKYPFELVHPRSESCLGPCGLVGGRETRYPSLTKSKQRHLEEPLREESPLPPVSLLATGRRTQQPHSSKLRQLSSDLHSPQKGVSQTAFSRSTIGAVESANGEIDLTGATLVTKGPGQELRARRRFSIGSGGSLQSLRTLQTMQSIQNVQTSPHGSFEKPCTTGTRRILDTAQSLPWIPGSSRITPLLRPKSLYATWAAPGDNLGRANSETGTSNNQLGVSSPRENSKDADSGGKVIKSATQVEEAPKPRGLTLLLSRLTSLSVRESCSAEAPPQVSASASKGTNEIRHADSSSELSPCFTIARVDTGIDSLSTSGDKASYRSSSIDDRHNDFGSSKVKSSVKGNKVKRSATQYEPLDGSGLSKQAVSKSRTTIFRSTGGGRPGNETARLGSETTRDLPADTRLLIVKSQRLQKSVGNDWNIDILGMGSGYPMAFVEVGFALLEPLLCRGSQNKISSVVLQRFLTTISDLYQFTPYHNAMHGAEVGHCIVYLSRKLHLWAQTDDRERAAIVVAALCHDVGHPGRNNHFFINSYDQLAIIYNDQAVLENFHAYTTFKTLDRDGCDVFENLTDAEFRLSRQQIIELILATDMKQHFESVARLKVRASNPDFAPQQKQEDRALVSKMCMKLADLSHAAFIWPAHFEWSCRIAEEFYDQGDEEEELCLLKSPLCDRSNHADFPKSQIGFIDFVVKPLAVGLAALDKSGVLKAVVVSQLMLNSTRWAEIAAENAETGKVVEWPPRLQEMLRLMEQMRRSTLVIESHQFAATNSLRNSARELKGSNDNADSTLDYEDTESGFHRDDKNWARGHSNSRAHLAGGASGFEPNRSQKHVLRATLLDLASGPSRTNDDHDFSSTFRSRRRSSGVDCIWTGANTARDMATSVENCGRILQRFPTRGAGSGFRSQLSRCLDDSGIKEKGLLSRGRHESSVESLLEHEFAINSQPRSVAPSDNDKSNRGKGDQAFWRRRPKQLSNIVQDSDTNFSKMLSQSQETIMFTDSRYSYTNVTSRDTDTLPVLRELPGVKEEEMAVQCHSNNNRYKDSPLPSPNDPIPIPTSKRVSRSLSSPVPAMTRYCRRCKRVETTKAGVKIVRRKNGASIRVLPLSETRKNIKDAGKKVTAKKHGKNRGEQQETVRKELTRAKKSTRKEAELLNESLDESLPRETIEKPYHEINTKAVSFKMSRNSTEDTPTSSMLEETQVALSLNGVNKTQFGRLKISQIERRLRSTITDDKSCNKAKPLLQENFKNNKWEPAFRTQLDMSDAGDELVKRVTPAFDSLLPDDIMCQQKGLHSSSSDGQSTRDWASPSRSGAAAITNLSNRGTHRKVRENGSSPADSLSLDYGVSEFPEPRNAGIRNRASEEIVFKHCRRKYASDQSEADRSESLKRRNPRCSIESCCSEASQGDSGTKSRAAQQKRLPKVAHHDAGRFTEEMLERPSALSETGSRVDEHKLFEPIRRQTSDVRPSVFSLVDQNFDVVSSSSVKDRAGRQRVDWDLCQSEAYQVRSFNREGHADKPRKMSAPSKCFEPTTLGHLPAVGHQYRFPPPANEASDKTQSVISGNIHRAFSRRQKRLATGPARYSPAISPSRIMLDMERTTRSSEPVEYGGLSAAARNRQPIETYSPKHRREHNKKEVRYVNDYLPSNQSAFSTAAAGRSASSTRQTTSRTPQKGILRGSPTRTYENIDKTSAARAVADAAAHFNSDSKPALYRKSHLIEQSVIAKDEGSVITPSDNISTGETTIKNALVYFHHESPASRLHRTVDMLSTGGGRRSGTRQGRRATVGALSPHGLSALYAAVPGNEALVPATVEVKRRALSSAAYSTTEAEDDGSLLCSAPTKDISMIYAIAASLPSRLVKSVSATTKLLRLAQSSEPTNNVVRMKNEQIPHVANTRNTKVNSQNCILPIPSRKSMHNEELASASPYLSGAAPSDPAAISKNLGNSRRSAPESLSSGQPTDRESLCSSLATMTSPTTASRLSQSPTVVSVISPLHSSEQEHPRRIAFSANFVPRQELESPGKDTLSLFDRSLHTFTPPARSNDTIRPLIPNRPHSADVRGQPFRPHDFSRPSLDERTTTSGLRRGPRGGGASTAKGDRRAIIAASADQMREFIEPKSYSGNVQSSAATSCCSSSTNLEDRGASGSNTIHRPGGAVTQCHSNRSTRKPKAAQKY